MARDGVAVASVLDPRLGRAVREAWVAMNVTSDGGSPDAAPAAGDGASEVGSSVEGSESAE